MIHYLNEFLLEGRDVLPASVREMTAELLRWKGVSAGDSLPPLLPDPSIIYTGTPQQWYLPVNRAWNIPLEGFGYLEWDDSGLQNKPGRVSQAPYCFGMLPEAALLLFHPLDGQVTLYVEAPIRLEKRDTGTIIFETLAGQDSFQAALEGEPEHLGAVTVWGGKIGGRESSGEVGFEEGSLWEPSVVLRSPAHAVYNQAGSSLATLAPCTLQGANLGFRVGGPHRARPPRLTRGY